MSETSHQCWLVLFTVVVGLALAPWEVIATWNHPAYPFNHSLSFTHEVYPKLKPNSTDVYQIGQQIRLQLRSVMGPFNCSVANYSSGPCYARYFNSSSGRFGIKVRVEPAYVRRQQSGSRLLTCNETEAWAESQDLTLRALVFGNFITMDGHFTFHMPSFPWQVCVSYDPPHSQESGSRRAARNTAAWHTSLYYNDTRKNHDVVHLGGDTPFFYYETPTTVVEQDFGSIHIIRPTTHPLGHWPSFPYGQTVPAHPATGDNVKLVPVGYPCSYDRDSKFENHTFCGTNMLSIGTGTWKANRCLQEGSVRRGVAAVGTRRRNPFVDTFSASDYPRLVTKTFDGVNASDTLAAYFEFPDAGAYDVCYSPSEWREEMASRDPEVFTPLWFKIFAHNGGSPTFTRFHIATRDASSLPQFSLTGPADGLSWGSVRISSAAADLSTLPAKNWDPRCGDRVATGCNKDYWTTTGGDMFRLVADAKFTTSPSDDLETYQAGHLHHLAQNGVPQVGVTTKSWTEVYGSESILVAHNADPPLGTSTANVGCWYSAEDNYGADEMPNGIAPCGTSCETGDSGKTATGDLTSSPRNAVPSDEAGVLETYAPIRFPSSGHFRVCYKKAGTHSWQYLAHSTSHPVQDGVDKVTLNRIDITPYTLYGHNVTWAMNDTRAGSWGALELHSPHAVLTTMPSSYFNQAVADTSVEGQTVKFVLNSEACDSGSVYSGVYLTDAGLAECKLGICTATGCAECTGSNDDSTTLRHMVTYHFTVPDYTTTDIRVCYRRKNNWYQLRKFGATRMFFGPFQQHQRISWQLSDTREGTWARLFFIREDGGPLNSLAHNGVHGDVMRLVPNTTRCDVTWDGTTANYVAANLVSDLGVYCRHATSSGVCSSSIIKPAADGINATMPHYNVNLAGDSNTLSTTMAALTLPAASASIGYRVCYKQAVGNWLDLAPQLHITAPSDVAYHPYETLGLSGAAKSFVAGSYDFVIITSNAAQIDLATALVKLVAHGSTCDAPSVGTHTSQYEAITSATHRGALIVDYTNENVTSGATSSAKAFMTFPTITNVPSTDTVTSYEMCYGSKNGAVSWRRLATISVTTYSVGYAASEQPVAGAAFRLIFNAYGSRSFNTLPGGDAMKLVARSSPCAENTTSRTYPIVTSLHVGRELPTNGSTSAEALSAGFLDLGPGNVESTATAEAIITLPAVAGDSYYRVCYLPAGTDKWIQLEQIAQASRPYDLGTGPFVVNYHGVETVTVSSQIRGVTPSSGFMYHSLDYTNIVFGGTATTFNAESTGGSTSYTYSFYVSGSGLSTDDQLRLIRVNTETVSGVWTESSAFTCLDSTVEATYSPNSASTSTTSYFSFNMPTTPGRFIICYKKNGATQWIQPAAASGETNPLTILSQSVYARALATSVQVVDVTETSDQLNHAAVSVEDLFYIADISGVCGLANTFDGNSTATAGSSITVDNHVWGTLYAVANVVTPWYPITQKGSYVACYYRAWQNATSLSTAVVPPMRAGNWYRIPVFYDNVLQNIYFVNTQPSLLSVTCPANDQTAGAAFQVSVAVKDDNNNTIPSQLPREVTAISADGWIFNNDGGMCDRASASAYAVASHNAIVGSTTGTSTFSITPLSSCGSASNDTCSLHFTSPNMPDSSSCTFSVNKTQTLDRLTVSTAPTSCRINKQCLVEVTPLLPDGAASYVTTGNADVVMTTHPGLLWSVNGGSDIDGGAMSIELVHGRLVLNLMAKFGDISTWNPGFGVRTIVLDIKIAGLSISHTFTVERLSLARIQILDLHPVNWDGTDANDEESNQNSKWEPSTTFSDFWNVNTSRTSQNIVDSVPDYPLVGGQYYKVTLVALDTYGEPLITPDLIQTSQTITMQHEFHARGEYIIGQPSSLEESYSYDGLLQPTAFDSVKKSLVFRVKNNAYCPKATGCKLKFLFGGKDLNTETYIKTPIRSKATKMQVACGLGVASSATPIYTSTCPVTSVETGLSVQIRAVDEWGVTDEYFEGDFYATLDSLDSTNHVTRITNLLQKNTKLTSIRAVAGVATVKDLTLVRPCYNQTCTLSLMSDWNVQRSELDITVNPSTTSLSCLLSDAKKYYVLSADRSNIIKTYGSSDNAAEIAIYPDTDVCFKVAAANANGATTLYETSWVHFAVQSMSGDVVTATPAKITPYKYKPLKFSEADFCFNVQGSDGAKFRAVFSAQRFNNPNHWATANGECATTTFTLTTRKFIGGLRIKSVNVVTELPKYSSPAATVWGYKQLSDTKEENELTVRFDVLDHYGNVVEPTAIAAAQNSHYVSIGRCVDTDITLNVCGEGTGVDTDRAISIVSPHAPQEGGMLRVSLVSATFRAFNSGLNFKINVKQWCLKCDIPFYIYSGTSKFNDPIGGTITSTLSLSVLIPESTPRYVSFRNGNSPFKPPSVDRDGFTRTNWPLWQPSSGLRPTSKTNPILFNPQCVDGSDHTCKADSRLFLTPACASSSPDTIQGANGEFMKLFVTRSTVPIEHGEAACIGDCTFQANAVQAQVDIFNAYTIAVSIGTQRLRCVGGAACTGDNTNVVSQSYAALGTTVPLALEALASKPFNSATMQLVGLDASQFYTTSPSTGQIDGSASPTVRGAFLATATSGNLAVNPLNTTSGLSIDAAQYEFVWRAPRPITTVVLLPSAVGVECVNPPTYALYSSPTVGTYTGYGATAELKDINLAYASTTIPVGQAFPFTLELRDANNELVPNASGTVTVERAGWYGCGNGGTLEVVSGDTFNTGRATVWVKFSAPCQQCAIRFTITPDGSQSTMYSSIANSDVKRRIVAQPLNVVDYSAGSATTVFDVSTVSDRNDAVTIDTNIHIRAQAFSSVSGMAVGDQASTIEVAAYTQIAKKDRMIVVGNGGILRQTSQQLNFARHSVRVSGTGAVELNFAFQRTCQSCNVLIQWHLPTTKTTGTFIMRNKGGQNYAVSAPSSTPIIFGGAPGILPHTSRHSFAIWKGQKSSTIPFAGFSQTGPSAIVPTLSVIDGRSGNGGDLTYATTTASASMIYHVRTTEPCFECRLGFGSASHTCILQAVATHYRITKVSPTYIQLGDEVTVEAYASDDKGFLDATVGGSSRCKFIAPFFCKATAARTLNVGMSQEGRVADLFYPAQSYMSMGGTTSSDFSLQIGNNFHIIGGETPEGGIKFRVLGAPVAKSIPIISDLGGLSSASYPTYPFHVDIGLEGLQLVNDQPGFDVEIYEMMELQVAFTKQMPNSTMRFVAPTPNNTIVARFTGECNVQLENNQYYQRMVNGIARFRMHFYKKNIGQLCRVQFSSVTGNVKCETVSQCTTVSEIKAFEREATSWAFAEPDPYMNGENFYGPKYASIGRSQLITAQLWEKSSAGSTRAQSCGAAGCSVALTPKNCAPVPEVIPSGGARFNENGTATLRVVWKESRDKESNALVDYKCSLLSSIIGATVDGPPDTTFEVSTCNTARLKVLVNQTRVQDLIDGTLYSGKVYPFEVGMYDLADQPCHGDSQVGISTLITVTAVGADGQAVDDIEVINTNVATAPESMKGKAYSNQAHLAFGAFQFRVVFSNSSSGRLIRLRFTATSSTPQIFQSILSPPFKVATSSTRLVVHPHLPKHVNSLRPYKFSVMATDAVPEQWLADNDREPFVDTTRSDPIVMDFNPSFRRVVPLTFNEGTAVTSLEAGRREYEVVFGMGSGNYAFTIYSLNNGINATHKQELIVQIPAGLALRTLGYRSNAPDICFSSCTLPEQVFDDDEALSYMNTSTTSTMDFTVMFADSDGTPMVSEEVEVSCGLALPNGELTNATGVNIAEAPALMKMGPLKARLKNGMANFSVGFVGQTGNATEPHVPVVLKCRLEDPLFDHLPVFETRLLHVDGFNQTEERTAALEDSPVIKVPTNLPNLGAFNETLFRTNLLNLVNGFGINYITEENALRVFEITACQVSRDYFLFADLRGSVCGSNHTCTYKNLDCPPHVILCTCPEMHNPNLRHMNKLQFSGEDIQLEIAVNINEAPGFRAANAEAVTVEHAKLLGIIVDALASSTNPNSPFHEFQLVADTVLTSSKNSPTSTAIPTPAPTNVTVDETPAPTPVPTVSAVPASTWWCFLLMIVAFFVVV